MNDKKYLNFLAKVGVSSAHPGGLALTKMLLNYVNLNSSESILDVGCGTGETSVYIAKYFNSNVVAVDNHPMMVEHAKERIKREGVNVKLHQANVESLPFNDGSFDKVLAESVTVFTDINKSLKQYQRVLKPGGKLVDIEMTSDRMMLPQEKSEIQRVYGINNVLTSNEWKAEMKKAGFKKVEAYRGIDFLKYNTEFYNAPGFELTDALDAEVFEVWLSHIKLMEKYKDLNYRVYIAEA